VYNKNWSDIAEYKNTLSDFKNINNHKMPFLKIIITLEICSYITFKLFNILFIDNLQGEGSHLSVYIHMLTGEYDALLEWPFSQPITFQLIDQNENHDERQTVMERLIPGNRN